jgi:Zn-dependent peptidase ImmA (M78 family)
MIPVKFKLGGLDITIEYQNDLAKTKGLSGQAVYTEQKIVLDGSAQHEQSIEQTFCHELVHYILSTMGEEDLCNNEKFVDVFATFLHQVKVTSEYSDSRTED